LSRKRTGRKGKYLIKRDWIEMCCIVAEDEYLIDHTTRLWEYHQRSNTDKHDASNNMLVYLHCCVFRLSARVSLADMNIRQGTEAAKRSWKHTRDIVLCCACCACFALPLLVGTCAYTIRPSGYLFQHRSTQYSKTPTCKTHLTVAINIYRKFIIAKPLPSQ
jgi:hypothetical protein